MKKYHYLKAKFRFFTFLLIIFSLPLISNAIAKEQKAAKQTNHHQIKMLNRSNDQSMVFEPAFLKVKKNDVITFTPTDLTHNSRSAFLPEGAQKWQGKNNQEITVTLEKEGIYIYECSNHTLMGMVGVIQVGEASNLDEAKDFAMKKKFATNKDRLAKYLENAK